MPPKPKPCTVEGCPYLKRAGNPRYCEWHWLERQGPDIQARESRRRLSRAKEEVGFLERGRVPESEWPDGQRWCAGCQGFVPLFYVRGSRCRGCASKAAHRSHIERTYQISYEDYERLYAFQGGRCYVCWRQPKSRRLAVDHDHATGEVRGLLCSDDEWGCNVSLRRILGDLEAAKRLLAYVERPPLQRMREGEAPTRPAKESVTMRLLRESAQKGREAAQDRQEQPAGPKSADWQSDPAWSF